MSEFVSKFLHCRIRVRDLEKSVRFYSEAFGFRKVGEHTSPAGNELVFIELPGNTTLIELCYQPNSPAFEVPEDLFHFAFTVPDLDEFRKRWEPRGVEFWPEDGPVGGRFYFVDDPDGYEIEVFKSEVKD